jgi:hypothetical protein
LEAPARQAIGPIDEQRDTVVANLVTKNFNRRARFSFLVNNDGEGKNLRTNKKLKNIFY